MMLAETTLDFIGIMIQICDDKEKTKNAIASVFNEKEPVKKESSKENYIREKLDILEDFKIFPSPEQLEYMNTLPTVHAIDRYARQFILAKLG